MNHTFRGRTWRDDLEPEKVREDAYAIERVSLLVAKGNSSRGRWEAHSKSNSLMRRLDTIGRKAGLFLEGMSIAGKPIKPRFVGGLGLYLIGCNGLQSFRRASRSSSTRADLAALLAKVGIKYHTYVQKPTSEVSAGRSHEARA